MRRSNSLFAGRRKLMAAGASAPRPKMAPEVQWSDGLGSRALHVVLKEKSNYVSSSAGTGTVRCEGAGSHRGAQSHRLVDRLETAVLELRSDPGSEHFPLVLGLQVRVHGRHRLGVAGLHHYYRTLFWGELIAIGIITGVWYG